MKNIFRKIMIFQIILILAGNFLFSQGRGRVSAKNIYSRLNSSIIEGKVNFDYSSILIRDSRLHHCPWNDFKINYNCFNKISFTIENLTDNYIEEVVYKVTIKSPNGKILFNKNLKSSKIIDPDATVVDTLYTKRNVKTRFAINRGSFTVNFKIVKLKVNKLKQARHIVKKGLVVNSSIGIDECIKIAKKYYSKIEKDPKFIEYYYSLALSYQKAKEYSDAVKHWKKYLILEPKSKSLEPRTREALINLAKSEYLNTEYEKSIVTWKLVLDFDPGYIEAYLGITDCNFGQNDYNSALSNFEKYVDLYHQNKKNKPALFRERIRISILSQQYKKAIDYGSKAVEMFPGDRSILANLAHAYLFSGQFEKAREIYELPNVHSIRYVKQCRRWADTVKQHIDGFRKLVFVPEQMDMMDKMIKPLQEAKLFYDNQEWKKAIKYLDQLIEIDMDHAEYYYKRAFSKMSLKMYADAIDDFENFLMIVDGSSAKGLYNYAECYRKTRKYDLAIKQYDLAVKLDSNGAFAKDIFFNRAISKSMIDDYQGAALDFDRAMRLAVDKAHKPSEIRLCYRRTIWYSLLAKQISNALSIGKEAAKSYPDDLNIQCLLAHAYLLSDQYTNAHNTYQLIVNKIPNQMLDWAEGLSDEFTKLQKLGMDHADMVKIKKIFAPIKAAKKYYGQAEYSKALRAYNLVIEVDSTQKDPFFNRGYALMSHKKYKEAISDCEYYLILHDDDSRNANWNLGKCRYNLGEYELAVDAYDEAIDAGEDNAALLISRGDCYFELGDYDDAVDDYEDAYDIKVPKSEQYYWAPPIEIMKKLINACVMDEEEEDAADYIRNTRKLSNLSIYDDNFLWIQFAHTQLLDGKYKEAKDSYIRYSKYRLSEKDKGRPTCYDIIIADFERFKKADIEVEDVKKIEALIKR